VWSRLTGALRRADRAADGLALDGALYAGSALFAWATALWSTLGPHRSWGAIAAVGYALATAAALAQVLLRGKEGVLLNGKALIRRPSFHQARAVLAGVTFVAVAIVPLVVLAVSGQAQDEVGVIQDGGQRLLDAGTPYLGRSAIAALPADERLTGYLPYQPGMAVFGLPRALDPAGHWWSDARVWFALITVLALGAALLVLRRAGADPGALVRGLQVATVLPLCALTLATGGDDLPVLALCLLALALAATGRLGWSGLAVGVAASLKLFAWPVAIVVAAYALTRRRLIPYALGAVGLPVITAIPAVAADPGALVENVFAFPLGRGLVRSPAASPLPGHLIASTGAFGRTVTVFLIIALAAIAAVVLIMRPPRTAAAASLYCAAGLLGALLLLPATRFGYLLYPVAFAVWAAALALPRHNDAT
jgi:hypothetical protein